MKLFEVLHRDSAVRAAQGARQGRPKADGAHRRDFARHLRQRAIQPAVGGGLQAGRAGLHVILRIEVRARGIGRAGGVHDREMLLIPQRLQRRERRMQPEEAVEIDGACRPRRPPTAAGRRWWAADRNSAARRAAPRCSDHRPRRAGRSRPEFSCGRPARRRQERRARSHRGAAPTPTIAKAELRRKILRETDMLNDLLLTCAENRESPASDPRPAGRRSGSRLWRRCCSASPA